jgi:hypothetical protein
MQFRGLKILNQSLKTYYSSLDSVPSWQDIPFPLFTGQLYKNRYKYSYIWKVLRLTIPTGDLDLSLSLFRQKRKSFPRPKMKLISVIRIYMHHIDQIIFANYSISIALMKITFTLITAVKELNSYLTLNIHSLHFRKQ